MSAGVFHLGVSKCLASSLSGMSGRACCSGHTAMDSDLVTVSLLIAVFVSGVWAMVTL